MALGIRSVPGGLRTDDFFVPVNWVEYSRDGLADLAGVVEAMGAADLATDAVAIGDFTEAGGEAAARELTFALERHADAPDFVADPASRPQEPAVNGRLGNGCGRRMSRTQLGRRERAVSDVLEADRRAIEIRVGGEMRDVTVFFSDLARFSSTAEQLSPDALVQLMNEYLSAMTDIIDEAALDPYIYIRDAWLQRRRSLVYDGEPPPDTGHRDAAAERGRAGADARPDDPDTRAPPRGSRGRGCSASVCRAPAS